VDEMPSPPTIPSMPAAIEPPPPRARRPGRKRLAWAVGVLVAIGIAAFVLWPRDRLPAELGGQPLVHSELLDQLEESMDAFDIGDFSIDVAFYGGSPFQPYYMAIVTSGPAPLDPSPGGSLFDELPGGLITQPDAEIDFSRSIERTADGVEYVCAPGTRTDVGAEVSICIFEEEFAGFVISTIGTDLGVLLQLTIDLHDHVA
jgi:hypothetical protein